MFCVLFMLLSLLHVGLCVCDCYLFDMAVFASPMFDAVFLFCAVVNRCDVA